MCSDSVPPRRWPPRAPRSPSLIGAQPAEIVFTGCATEANNLALCGVAQAVPAQRRHLVISAVEHPAVMAPALYLRHQGWEVTVLPVDSFGRVSVDDVAGALRPDTALVSVMHANNEVGTLQPVAGIAALTRPRGILLHTDAAQSAGKLRVDVDELGVDLLTLAGHKFNAPKGVGALYVRAGTPIRAIVHGADQEHGLRPGTENVASIVALGAAAALASASLPDLSTQLQALRDRLHAQLEAGVPGLQLNGHPQSPAAEHLARLVPRRQRPRTARRCRRHGGGLGRFGLPLRARCGQRRVGRHGHRCRACQRRGAVVRGTHDPHR